MRLHRKNVEELRTQSIRFEQSLRIRLDKIYNAIRTLPRVVDYTGANGVVLKDMYGIETMLPMDLCQNAEQFRMTFKAAAVKWSPYERLLTERWTSTFVMGEGHVVSSGPDLLWLDLSRGSIDPGIVVRLIAFMWIHSVWDDSEASTVEHAGYHQW